MLEIAKDIIKKAARIRWDAGLSKRRFKVLAQGLLKSYFTIALGSKTLTAR
jgi:hypothetical protein